MRALGKMLGWAILVCLVWIAATWAWVSYRMNHDDLVERPSYVQFEMGNGAADGSDKPAANGYIVDKVGVAHILPPMPSEKPQDIHTGVNYLRDASMQSCFWPGGRARSGVFSNEWTAFQLENAFADTATTYMPTAFQIPEGAAVVMKGEFAHVRHWSLNTYNDKGEAQDMLSDVEIEPDAGSVNPFRIGSDRNALKRNYTVSIVNGKPAKLRDINTLYTNAEPGKQIVVWARYFVPDKSVDFLGGAALPSVELHLADGKVLTGDAACEATQAPMRGHQMPTAVTTKMWLMLTHLPWVDSDNVGARNFQVAPFSKFFNRTQVLTDLFAPVLTKDAPPQIGSWYNNLATQYGYFFLSRNFGKVYVMTAKMPKTPQTWHGESMVDADVDMRYMSVCTGAAPPSASTVDCVYDEQLLPSVDKAGRFMLVISRSEDRPKNATLGCGVAWIDFGNGDGLPGGSPNFAQVVNRHTLVSDKFQHSWFAPERPTSVNKAMGEYLPYMINMKEKESFEGLGCPVDKSKIRKFLPKTD